MTHTPQVPDHNLKFYEDENLKHLPIYVLRLMLEGMPMWMVDVERCDFRTGMDTGANLNALMVWNRVRGAHGFENLTVDDLWKRHQEDQNWTDEYRDYTRWAMNVYRLEKTFPDKEFEGKKFRD